MSSTSTETDKKLTENIYSILKDVYPTGLQAKTIVKELEKQFFTAVTRTDVNRILYKETTDLFRSDQLVSPPCWYANRFSRPEPPSEESKNGSAVPTAWMPMIIMVDLGNVHDCLENLVPYASNTAQVRAYADVGFNGYGINPCPPCNIKVVKATSNHKNAADIDLIFDLALMAHQHKTPHHFVIATKDKGFLSVESKLQQLGHQVSFVTGWSELRLLVE